MSDNGVDVYERLVRADTDGTYGLLLERFREHDKDAVIGLMRIAFLEGMTHAIERETARAAAQ